MTKHWTLLPLSATIAAVTVAVPPPAFAAPNSCIEGYVPRLAQPSDQVCVTPAVAARTAQENSNPALNKEPGGGAYGPETCTQGFVWREAFDGDSICVTPEIRAQTLADNAAAQSRKATPPTDAPSNTSAVLLEVFGNPDAEHIELVLGSTVDSKMSAVPLPWSRTIAIGPDVPLVWLKAYGYGNSSIGCRITADGKVAQENSADSNLAFCEWRR